MFKSEFQGGPTVEVFSAQRKDPVSQWKLTGVSNNSKRFDPDVKSYVYCLEGTNTSTKMQLPRDSKQALGLLQRYLVLQVLITKGEDFSLEIGIYDSSNSSRRRLGLSTTYKEIQVTTLHTKIPMTLILKSVWLNLCIDLASLVSETWKGQMYKSLESIGIGGHCRLRRIFTMKSQPYDTTNDLESLGCVNINSLTELESIPRQCVLPPDLIHYTQVINMMKIKHCDGKSKCNENHKNGSELDLSVNSNSRKINGLDDYHIAFGKKMSGSAPQSRKGSGKENERKGSGKEERRSAGKDSDRRSAMKDSELDDKKGTEEGQANREIKPQHFRSTSDSDSNIPRRIPHLHKTDKLPVDSANKKLVKSENSSYRRERRDSDPGASQNDPDITVDKESLRSSHTWTDGADGQEAIPFVKPHPPSKPSSAKHRRPVRIKSADSTSQSSNPTPPTKSPQSGFIHNNQPVQPMMVANEAEMEDILLAMQKSAQRQLATGDDKFFTDSDNTSGVHEGDDSIIDVIKTLNNKKLDDDVTGGEYEESEEDDEAVPDDAVYSFSSAPRQAPRSSHKIHHSPIKTSAKYHRTRVRKRTKGGKSDINDSMSGKFEGRTSQMNGIVVKNKVLTKSQSDFVGNVSSDEDDNVLQARQAAVKRRSPRGKQNKKYLQSGYNSKVITTQYSPDKQHINNPIQNSSGKHFPHHKTSSDEIDSSTYTKEAFRSYYSNSYHHNNYEHLQIPISAHSPHLPEWPMNSSPGYGSPNGQARISFSKRELREIPKKELQLRKSGGSRQYNPDVYRMGSESMENRMLDYMKNMSDDDSGNDKKQSTMTSTKQSVNKYKFDGSDSDETTMNSTLKAPSEKDHNYLDEMDRNTFYHEDAFTMSCPRVFSPEIVLPSQKSKAKQHQENGGKIFHQREHLQSGNSALSSDDELELLFDFVLGCYYDPKTNIFYQLK